MKQGLIIVGVLVVIIGGFFIWTFGVYDDAVQLQEQSNQTWADVEADYQRRADLIPNLVSTVKGSAEHEKETLTAVVEARAKATSMTIDPSNLNAETMQKFQAVQGELSGALSRLLVSVERYPDLKANSNFLTLQSQLEGAENRISTSRKRYNEAVTSYNTFIRGKLKSMALGFIGGPDEFPKKTLFEAAAGSDVAPTVSFE
jgi:LemA protein